MNIRNITCLKPRNSSIVFRKIEKGSDVFLPMDIALVYAQDLLGRREVPNYATESIVQRKLDNAFNTRISPWHIVIKEKKREVV